MTPALPDMVLPKLGSLIRLLSSDHDHEALAAARGIGRVLRGVGLDIHSLAEAVEHPAVPALAHPRPRRPSGNKAPLTWSSSRRLAVAKALATGLKAGAFTKWEQDFFLSIRATIDQPHCMLSPKQIDVINKLLTKVRRAGP